MATNFRVRTQAAAYVDGYQNGMRDIYNAMLSDDLEGIQEWLRNNYTRKAEDEAKQSA